VEKVKTGAYNAVLMDVQMSEMDGLEASRQIRADPEITQHIPIIAMTAHALKGDRERCLEAGMDDYVSKPIDAKSLLAVLDRWTGDQVQERPAGAVEAGLETQDYSIQADLFPLEEGPTSTLDGLFGENSAAPIQKSAEELVSPLLEEQPGPPMDIQTALPRFNNDRAFLLEMGQDLIRNMPKRMEELRSTYEKQDPAGFSRAAHNLKGISAYFDATQVNRIAAELEKMGRRNDLSTAATLLDRLELENKRLIEYMFSLGVKPPQ